jgi:hypothetical protein
MSVLGGMGRGGRRTAIDRAGGGEGEAEEDGGGEEGGEMHFVGLKEWFEGFGSWL